MVPASKDTVPDPAAVVCTRSGTAPDASQRQTRSPAVVRLAGGKPARRRAGSVPANARSAHTPAFLFGPGALPITAASVQILPATPKQRVVPPDRARLFSAPVSEGNDAAHRWPRAFHRSGRAGQSLAPRSR